MDSTQPIKKIYKPFNAELYSKDKSKYFRDYMRQYNQERVECDICKRALTKSKINRHKRQVHKMEL